MLHGKLLFIGFFNIIKIRPQNATNKLSSDLLLNKLQCENIYLSIQHFFSYQVQFMSAILWFCHSKFLFYLLSFRILTR